MDIKPDNLCAEINNGQLHPYVVDFGSSLMQATGKLLLSHAVVQLMCGHDSSMPCTVQQLHIAVHRLSAWLPLHVTCTPICLLS